MRMLNVQGDKMCWKERRHIDECDMEEIGTQLIEDSSEMTIAILGDRWWPQTTKQAGDSYVRLEKKTFCM